MYGLLPTDLEGFDSLAELALDMRWSWNHATDDVWRKLDPALSEITHNPWAVLQTVSRDNIAQQGYFRQMIGKDGSQEALFPYNDPGQLPITPVRRANGEWLRMEIALPGYSVWLRAWQR